MRNSDSNVTEEQPEAEVVEKGVLIERTRDGRYRLWELRDFQLSAEFAARVEELTKEQVAEHLEGLKP